MIPEHLFYQPKRVFGQNITNTLPRAKTPPPIPPPPPPSSTPWPLPLSHEHAECKDIITNNNNMNNDNYEVDAYCRFQHQLNNANNNLFTSDCEKMELEECEQQCKRIKRDPCAGKTQMHYTTHHHKRTLSVPPTVMFTPNERVYRRSMKVSETNVFGNEEQSEQRQLFISHKDNHNNNYNLQSESATQLLKCKELQPPLFPPIFANTIQNNVKINNSDDKDEHSENSSNSSITFSDLDDVSPITLFDQTARMKSSIVHNEHNNAHNNDKNIQSNNRSCNHYNSWQHAMCNDTNNITAWTTSNIISEYALFTPEMVSLMMKNTQILEERLHIEDYRDLL